jgi:hypothetical protein
MKNISLKKCFCGNCQVAKEKNIKNYICKCPKCIKARVCKAIPHDVIEKLMVLVNDASSKYNVDNGVLLDAVKEFLVK